MPDAPHRLPTDPALATRLARFFRLGADPWERLAIPLPPQVFGLASQRDFSRYLEGASRVPVRSVAELCEWLRGCEKLDDLTLFCEPDYWQHPITFEQVRKGDCEDHALWAWRQLRHLGFPTLFMAGLYRGAAHAWVVWNDGIRDHLLETTCKALEMEPRDGSDPSDYCPAVAIDERLRTYVYQGYVRFHAASRGGPLCSLAADLEVAILAGGESRRMGRDKARIRVGGRSLLAHVRQAAAALGCPVRVIRRDVVAPCGPVGGVLTALEGARPTTTAILFLSCDMPSITPTLLQRVVAALGPRTAGVFVEVNGRLGFPFVVSTRTLAPIRDLHARGTRSLRSLAAALRSRRLPIPRRDQGPLRNVNTPADLAEFRRTLHGASRPC